MIDESTGRQFYWNGNQLFVEDYQKSAVQVVLSRSGCQGAWEKIDAPTSYGSTQPEEGNFLCWALEVSDADIAKFKVALDAAPSIFEKSSDADSS